MAQGGFKVVLVRVVLFEGGFRVQGVKNRV